MLMMWQTCWLCKSKKRLHTGSVPREDRKRNTAISGGCLCWMTQKLPESNLPTIQAFLDIFFTTGKPFKAISAKDGILVVFVLSTKAYGIRRIFFNKLLWIHSKTFILLEYKLFSPYPNNIRKHFYCIIHHKCIYICLDFCNKCMETKIENLTWSDPARHQQYWHLGCCPLYQCHWLFESLQV